jgi:hypothetical protein
MTPHEPRIEGELQDPVFDHASTKRCVREGLCAAAHATNAKHNDSRDAIPLLERRARHSNESPFQKKKKQKVLKIVWKSKRQHASRKHPIWIPKMLNRRAQHRGSIQTKNRVPATIFLKNFANSVQ